MAQGEAARGRRRGGVGQGRAPEEQHHNSAMETAFSEMQGLWLDLVDGRRSLVVATGTLLRTGSEVLLVETRGGGPRRVISWRGGQPEARVAPGERRELVEVGQPAMGPDGRYRGTWRHGNYVDAMVNVEGKGYSIRRVALSDQSPAERQRAHRLAARSLTEMNALTAIARRPARAVPVPAREAERPSAHQRRPASLGTRTPASQRGAARALFGSAPSTSETAQLRILAASSGGLLLDVVVLTASPFNADGSHIRGSSWAACHGGIQLARGSCSALTFNLSAALLAAAQEALLGVHSFLATSGISATRVRMGLSVRRAVEPRGGANPHVELSVAALTALYAALTGGTESLMGLTLSLAPHDAAGPRDSSAGLLDDLRRDAAAAANNLRDDLTHRREGQAIWADMLPGARAFVTAVEPSPRFDRPPVPSESLHLATTVGSFAPMLQALFGRRPGLGITEGARCSFGVMSSLPQTAEALATLTRSNAERDILLLSQAGRRMGLGRPGDLVAVIFGRLPCLVRFSK